MYITVETYLGLKNSNAIRSNIARNKTKQLVVP